MALLYNSLLVIPPLHYCNKCCLRTVRGSFCSPLASYGIASCSIQRIFAIRLVSFQAFFYRAEVPWSTYSRSCRSRTVAVVKSCTCLPGLTIHRSSLVQGEPAQREPNTPGSGLFTPLLTQELTDNSSFLLERNPDRQPEVQRPLPVEAKPKGSSAEKDIGIALGVTGGIGFIALAATWYHYRRRMKLARKFSEDRA